jgi:hypothetical protein
MPLSPRVDVTAREAMLHSLEMVDDAEVVDRAELMVLLAEDEAGVDHFVRNGVLKPTADGRFPLKESVVAYTAAWETVIAEQDAQADDELRRIEPHGNA